MEKLEHEMKKMRYYRGKYILQQNVQWLFGDYLFQHKIISNATDKTTRFDFCSFEGSSNDNCVIFIKIDLNEQWIKRTAYNQDHNSPKKSQHHRQVPLLHILRPQKL